MSFQEHLGDVVVDHLQGRCHGTVLIDYLRGECLEVTEPPRDAYPIMSQNHEIAFGVGDQRVGDIKVGEIIFSK